MVTKDEIKHVAKLARIEMTDAEIDYFAPQFGSIIAYIELLNTASVDGVEPTCYIEPAHDPMRDDIETPSMPCEELLANGPSVKKGHFAIPKIIEQG